ATQRMPVLSNPPFPHTYYEDFALDQVFVYGAHLMTDEAIIRFAREFDPEPFHLSHEAAKATPFGRLITSGPHLGAVWRRMNHDAFPHVRSGSSPGWDELRWKAPVFPGDVLSCSSRMVELRLLKSRANYGLVRWAHELRDQNGAVKMTHGAIFLVERRPA
ncbi:MAG: MaoC/PaaZ C-terminal domain-containing protein, partial [Alphaproteobacteria bacterium]